MEKKRKINNKKYISGVIKVTGQQEAFGIFGIIKSINWKKNKKEDSKMPNLWCKEDMVKLKFPPTTAVVHD